MQQHSAEHLKSPSKHLSEWVTKYCIALKKDFRPTSVFFVIPPFAKTYAAFVYGVLSYTLSARVVYAFIFYELKKIYQQEGRKKMHQIAI